MRPVRVAVPADDVSVVVPIDIYQKGPITVSIAEATGTPDIDVEYTLDDIWDPAVTPGWFPAGLPLNAVDATPAAGRLVDADTDQPVTPTAVRAINNNAASTAVMTIVQSGIQG
jgi:hypothetical protein